MEKCRFNVVLTDISALLKFHLLNDIIIGELNKVLQTLMNSPEPTFPSLIVYYERRQRRFIPSKRNYHLFEHSESRPSDDCNCKKSDKWRQMIVLRKSFKIFGESFPNWKTMTKELSMI